MKICAIVPTYDHDQKLGPITTCLVRHGLSVFIIDDGSHTPAAEAIAALHEPTRQVFVERLDVNQGKGAAVAAGFRAAIVAGFTHALQIDADGQHDLSVLPRFLDLARQFPQAVIIGQAKYDDSVPRSRRIGRWITHMWVWVETLSFRIKDSMCGMRVYPLDAVQRVMRDERLGRRMDFDTDILVRLFWRGTPPLSVPVAVVYPVGNTSNFKMGRDNWAITRMHTRLFLTMLARLPAVLSQRPPLLEVSHETDHWADLRERGALWGLQFCVFAYRWLGRSGCRAVLAPIALYFYLTGATQRRSVRAFLTKLLDRAPNFVETFRPYLNFALRGIDIFAAWTGQLKADIVQPTDEEELTRITNDPRGGLFITSHLGNADIARAMLDKKTRERLTVLVHTRHAENYNKLLREINPDAAINVYQVTAMGPETIINLKQRVENGEWIVIAGDRVSVQSRERAVRVSFFGADAAFPQGPWIVGALLECPVYLMFCLRDGDHYRFTLERFADILALPRQTRQQALHTYAARYAARLQQMTAVAPDQWYNFYDFWAPHS